ncbi:MAG: hypothetical protein M3680_26225 [Myxococcota bacterium]|nr:hypothetical protein [Myxococcota bacterium]
MGLVLASACSKRAEQQAPAEPAPAATSGSQERTPQLTAELRDTMSPDQVLQAFKDGHQRFLSRELRFRKLEFEVKDGGEGQHPYAIVLSCIDSRVGVVPIPVEI